MGQLEGKVAIVTGATVALENLSAVGAHALRMMA